MRHKNFLLLPLVVVLGLALSACQPAATTVEDTPVPEATEAPAEEPATEVAEEPTAEPTATPAEAEAKGETENVQTVSMVDTSFDPQELTVSVGTTVRWVNDSDLPHTTTADDGVWDSGNMDAGATFEFTFEEPGEYPYYCEFHGGPGGEGMSGTITVTEAGATGGGGETTSGDNGDKGGLPGY